MNFDVVYSKLHEYVVGSRKTNIHSRGSGSKNLRVELGLYGEHNNMMIFVY